MTQTAAGRMFEQIQATQGRAAAMAWLAAQGQQNDAGPSGLNIAGGAGALTIESVANLANRINRDRLMAQAALGARITATQNATAMAFSRLLTLLGISR